MISFTIACETRQPCNKPGKLRDSLAFCRTVYIDGEICRLGVHGISGFDARNASTMTKRSFMGSKGRARW